MNPRILLVDDEPAIRGALERALRRRGYDVVSAGSADAAFDALAHEQVDLILLDMRLPQVSGDALYFALVRQWPRLRDRVILMTGQPYEVEDEGPPEIQALPMLAKPFSLDRLYTLIEAMLREPPLRRQGNGP